MTKYEQLIDLVCESDIFYIENGSGLTPAHSVCVGGKYGIFFNRGAFGTDAERRVALAHEKAHCDTGSLYSVYAPMITRAQCENRAWKRTILDVMPFGDEFIKEFERCVYADGLDIYEFAEKLGITPEFAKQAIEYYHADGMRW
jgi:hypothetical protein